MVLISTRRLFRREDPQWDSYVGWIAHPELREVRTIDVALNEFADVGGNMLCEMADVDRAIDKLPIPKVGLEYYLLALRCEGVPGPRECKGFEFLGYDLTDDGMTSSLLNCGPWEGALAGIAERMNRYGLLEWEDAQLAKEALPHEWGEGESHAWVDIWALYGRES